MQGHIALYRTWRPSTFEDMVGQSHIVKTLRNALRENRLTHAYLFSGPRGTGKTTAAKILAKAVNCEHGPTDQPCNVCDACVRIMAGSVMDVIEIDAASNRGVEEIREIRDKVKYAPSEVRMKVYIIDEVHMLTTEAFNALLKTLEEPPAHVMFILATTEPHKIPATIQSRCQRFDFRRVAIEEQIERITYICEQEGLVVASDAIRELARMSDGGMRDALSLLDQVASFSSGAITLEQVHGVTGGMAIEQFARLAGAIAATDVASVLTQVEQLMMHGKSADRILEGLGQFYREALMVKLMPAGAEPLKRIGDISVLSGWAGSITEAQLFRWIETLQKYMFEMKQASQPRPILEVALMRCCVNETPAAVAPLVVQPTHQVAPVAPAASPVQAAPAQSPTPKPAFTPKPVGGMGVAKTSEPIEPFVSQGDSPLTQDVKSKWPALLEQMNKVHVSLRAWLINGQVVSATPEAILVAFKNDIHRDTTEKDANKAKIEEQLAVVYGKPYRLVTMMLRDWEKVAQAATAVAPEQPPLELLAMDEDGKSANGDRFEQEWITEAINLFGEDLVKIEENKD